MTETEKIRRLIFLYSLGIPIDKEYGDYFSKMFEIFEDMTEVELMDKYNANRICAFCKKGTILYSRFFYFNRPDMPLVYEIRIAPFYWTKFELYNPHKLSIFEIFMRYKKVGYHLYLYNYKDSDYSLMMGYFDHLAIQRSKLLNQ